MTILVIAAILSGLCALILVAPSMQTHPKTGFALMWLIPICSIALFMGVTYYGSQHTPTRSPSQKNEQIQKEITYEESALKNAPNNKDIILKLAGLHVAIEEYDKAISIIKGYDGYNDEHDLLLMLSTAYFSKGLLMAERKEYDSAMHYLHLAVTFAPSDAPFTDDIHYFIKKVEEAADQQDREDHNFE